MSPDKVRAFIAIELDDEIRRRLKKIQDSLRKTGTDIKWVDPYNIHLTLKFFGDVPINSLDKLCGMIEDGLKNFSKFEFYLESLGCFPSQGSPQILWAGISKGHKDLEQIEKTLAEKTSSFAEKPEDKKFSAHITIGRVRSNKNIATLIAVLKNSPCHLDEKQTVSFITLFKSDLTSSGPIYSPIKIFELK
jgi:2'-5' RNA ligase